jgi:serine protease Do
MDAIKVTSTETTSKQSPLQHRRAPILAVIFAILVSMASGFLGGWLGADRNKDQATSSFAANQKVVTSQSQLITRIAKSVGPSVVSVNVTGQTAAPAQSFYGFGISGGTQTQQSAGTGIIIARNLVLTNRHVVPVGTTSVSITLADGTQLDNVQVLGRTNASDTLDVAVLKLSDTKGHTLAPATIGDSSKMQVGDSVIAIGNALGQFQNTVTSGIISGYGRTVQAGDGSSLSTSNTENLADLFQTDAAINEGNSGGPLVNSSGQVIGINTATASNAQSIGFAIPINDVSGLIKEVIASGKFERPYLGVQYVSLTDDAAKQLNISQTRGAYIVPSSGGQPSIISGSPANKAGLQEKDIITAADGTAVDATHSLTSLLSQHQVGDKITLTVIRGSDTKHIDVTLAAAPSS